LFESRQRGAYEHSNAQKTAVQMAADFGCFFGRDETGTPRIEIETEGIRTFIDRQSRVP
jgi:hypothetical protein